MLQQDAVKESRTFVRSQQFTEKDVKVVDSCSTDEDRRSTREDKHSTHEEMVCMKKCVLTRFFDSTKYSGAPDMGLPFGCPTRTTRCTPRPKKDSYVPRKVGWYKHAKTL